MVASSAETIARFHALASEASRIELLDEQGRVTGDLRQAVELRATKRTEAGALLTVRLDIADAPKLGLAVEVDDDVNPRLVEAS